MNWRVWYCLLGALTLFSVFAFTIFRYEPLVSFEGISPGIGFLKAFGPKYTVRIRVEYSMGYLEGDPFRPASGLAVSLVDQVYTSSFGEAVFVVPPGSYTLSVENPVDLVRWSDVIVVQSNMTVRVRFDFEKIRFAKIRVAANFSQDASSLEFQFTVPKAQAAYPSSLFITCLDSNRRQCNVVEKLPFADNWLKLETLETYGIKLSGTRIVYVFPESSYISIGLIFVDI